MKIGARNRLEGGEEFGPVAVQCVDVEDPAREPVEEPTP